MYKGDQIELPKGGKERNELTELEKQEMANDDEYMHLEVDADYVKVLKERQFQQVYLETKQQRLFFTNSCWEIQRANSLQGGNIVIGEVVRFKHIGTGKFLSVEDGKDLVLRNNSHSLNCLFVIKSDSSQKKEIKYKDEIEMSKNNQIRSNQRVII